MKVYIKQFNVNMEIKTNGVELAIYSPDGAKHLGDLWVTARADWNGTAGRASLVRA